MLLLPADTQVVLYPRIRQWTAAVHRPARYEPMIHGLVEVDVTTARAVLRAQQAKTVESPDTSGECVV